MWPSIQSIECIGLEQKLKRCNGLKNFSASKLRWSLLSGSLGIKGKFGMQRRKPLICNHSQGTLHGQPDKVQCGVHWQHRQSQSFPLCSSITHLLNVLKFYGHNKYIKFVSSLYIVLSTTISIQWVYGTMTPQTLVCLLVPCSQCSIKQESCSMKVLHGSTMVMYSLSLWATESNGTAADKVI